MKKLQIKRGTKSLLSILEQGELAYALDTNELLIGVLENPSSAEDNMLVNSTLSLFTKTANHTLEKVDAGKVLIFNNEDPLTVTIPLNSSVDFPIGTQIAFLRNGTGTVTFAAPSGVDIRSLDDAVEIAGQYASAVLLQIAVDEWQLIGSLE